MSWSDELVAALDARATVVRTARGEVQLARRGAGPPVLVSHGAPGGFDQGLAWARHLRDGGCELLAPSRPGYLRTPLGSGRSPAEQADLFAALLDEIAIDRVSVLGFSSGGPAAVHFAGRHPDRTHALLLDAAILGRYETAMNAFERRAVESSVLVRLTHLVSRTKPGLLAAFMVRGMSAGLTNEQRRAAVDWIRSAPDRLERIRELSASIAPPAFRRQGWINDELNERDLAPLPFDDVAAPTLLAHGANDGPVPVEHSIGAAAAIAGAELMVVDEGHHALSLSRGYGPVSQRQVELARGQSGELTD
jgi:pimeloyl-ACP methyl ester carboxylesterase